MDEILIQEKRYVSSKRAAKITGYAKDYIGQLCREGRVPARLVGRSWYVLETAIKDHRFGNVSAPDERPVDAIETNLEKPEELVRKFPRYESAPIEVLPSLNLLKKAEVIKEDTPLKSEDHQEQPGRLYSTKDFNEPNSLHNSWNEWFDRVPSELELPVGDDVNHNVGEDVEIQAQLEDDREVDGIEDGGVAIPIHSFTGSLPNRELLPEKQSQEESIEVSKPNIHKEGQQPSKRQSSERKGDLIRWVQLVLVLLGIVSVVFSVLNSGYFDEYFISHNQAQFIPGISVYNK